jgi:hypothetical protein
MDQVTLSKILCNRVLALLRDYLAGKPTPSDILYDQAKDDLATLQMYINKKQ